MRLNTALAAFNDRFDGEPPAPLALARATEHNSPIGNLRDLHAGDDAPIRKAKVENGPGRNTMMQRGHKILSSRTALESRTAPSAMARCAATFAWRSIRHQFSITLCRWLGYASESSSGTGAVSIAKGFRKRLPSLLTQAVHGEILSCQ